MKKLAVLLIAGVLACGMLVGCGDSGSGDQGGDQAQTGVQEQTGGQSQTGAKNYSFTINGVDVAMHAEFAPLAEKIGAEDSYFESESCAFQGMDKVYTYGSVVVTTYPVDGVDYVYTIELKDDTVETAEGVYIGAAKADVTAAYGEAAQDTGTALVYEKGESTLSFMLDGDTVSSIVYTAVTE